MGVGFMGDGVSLFADGEPGFTTAGVAEVEALRCLIGTETGDEAR